MRTRRRVEYIWLDGKEGLPQLRSKTRYINVDETYVGVPDWNFDGGSTEQGSLDNSDRCLRVVRTYKDTFIEEGLLALCEVLYYTGAPHESNMRTHLVDVLGHNKDADLLGRI